MDVLKPMSEEGDFRGSKDKIFSRKSLSLSTGNALEITHPLVMGIVNTTPDSFFAESRSSEVTALERVQRMHDDGVDMIDIGGQSTRPGAQQVGAQEEMSRVLPVIEKVRAVFPDMVISVDTYYGEVAKGAVEAGADIINDISGGTFDPTIVAVAAETNMPFIIGHSPEKPEVMQRNPTYDGIVEVLKTYFEERIQHFHAAGVKSLVIDPCFGFGKTVDHNYQLMSSLNDFLIFGIPILVGVSRKSMINKVLSIKPEDALNGTTALNMAALLKGASILRVHDVREARETVQLFQKLKANS